MRTTRAAATLTALVLALATLTACHPTTPTPTTGAAATQAATTPTPTATTDPRTFTTALADRVAQERTVRAKGPLVQADQNMTVVADLSGLDDPDVSATVSFAGADASRIRVVDGTFYLDIGASLGHRFLIVTPGSSTSPLGEGYGGFVVQINPLRLARALEKGARAVVPDDKPTTVGGVAVDGYEVTVTRSAMSTVLAAQVGKNALSLLPDTVRVHVWLDHDGLLRKARWSVKGATATLTYSRWGKKVTVTAPPGAVNEHVLYG